MFEIKKLCFAAFMSSAVNRLNKSTKTMPYIAIHLPFLKLYYCAWDKVDKYNLYLAA
jgi:hypothetical protein